MGDVVVGPDGLATTTTHSAGTTLRTTVGDGGAAVSVVVLDAAPPAQPAPPGVHPPEGVTGPRGDSYVVTTDVVTGETRVFVTSPDGERRVLRSFIGEATVHANTHGDVLITTTTTTPEGRDTTIVTVVGASGGHPVDSPGIDGSPISVFFDGLGNARIPMLSTEAVSGDSMTAVALVDRDATCVVSEPVAGEPSGDAALSDDGRTFLPLTRFDDTRAPYTALVVVHPDATTTTAGEFTGHCTHGPAIASATDTDTDVVLVTHARGSATIRTVRWRSDDSTAGPSTPVFGVPATIVAVDPDTGAVRGRIGDPDDATLRYLTVDDHVELDSATGDFVFTPSPDQRRAATEPDHAGTHAFTTMVSDASGASTVVTANIPVLPVAALQTSE